MKTPSFSRPMATPIPEPAADQVSRELAFIGSEIQRIEKRLFELRTIQAAMRLKLDFKQGH